MFKRVLRAYGPFRRKVLPIFFFILAFEILDLYIPYLFGRAVDLVYKQVEFKIILAVIGLAAATSLVRQLLSQLKDFYELRKVDYRLENYIQQGTLAKLAELSIGQHRDKNSGVAESTITKGEKAMKMATEIILYQLSPLILQIIITSVALFVLDPLTGLVLASGMALHITISLLIGRRFIGSIKESMDMDDKDSGRHLEIVGAMPLIIGEAQEKRITKEFVDRLENTAVFKVKIWTNYILWNLVRNILGSLLRPAAVVIAVWQTSKGTYGPGHMVVVLMWAGHAIANIGAMPYFHRNLLNHWGSIKNYFALLDTPPRVKLAQNPLPFTGLKTGIELRGLSFSYDPEIEGEPPKTVLKEVNLFLPKGKRIALVGPSGSGKTTLVNLLRRGDDPCSGEILFDGVNLREVDLYQLRSRIGYVQQQVTLFDDTLGENIKLGLNGNASKVTLEQLNRVAKQARIDQFYHRLTKGFDTLIGEDGIKLSGGECQRVSIARALIKNPDILIFDEATSNLDTENEAIIKQSIDEVVQGRTAIFIAHRLSTVRDADLIVVMNSGRIVSTGTHQELLVGCPLYKRLVQMQELH